MVYVTECQHELPLSSQVFANTDCLRAAADAADADDISTLMADAKARGRIWDEDQAGPRWHLKNRREKIKKWFKRLQ
jgi:hypothetical protein